MKIIYVQYQQTKQNKQKTTNKYFEDEKNKEKQAKNQLKK